MVNAGGNNVATTFKAIPHKERTAKMSGKRYNKEVKKQLTMSLISDELNCAFSRNFGQRG